MALHDSVTSLTQSFLQIGIVFKFYEGSVGDQMARLKGGKLSLPDVLRYISEIQVIIHRLQVYFENPVSYFQKL